ncbi:MAG: glycosyltransferase [Gemmatimonadaceae bacterium]|jgi:glycosyltransferase involved in cell wall biosynthesis|nr:glycosyltransferase [Gemmatimonadaceae bacterium]
MTAAAPRLLLVATGLGLGGAETQVVLLAEAFAARGWRVRIVTLIPPTAFAERLDLAAIPVTSLGMRRGWPDPRALGRLAAIVRAWRPDVVHAHMVHANLLARLTRPLAPMPVLVCTAHSVDEGGAVLMSAYRATDCLGDLLTQVSAAGVARYRALGVVRAPERLVHVANGVPLSPADAGARGALRTALGTPSDALVATCVARLEAVKNHDVLLAAWARIAAPGRELWLVGDGPLRREVAARAAAVGATVRMLGARSDVPAILQASDVFVLASRYEGLPMSVLEAAAAGLPVVATAVGGIPEVVASGRDGLLVPPADEVALAEAMASVLAWPPATRHEAGAALRARVVASYALDAVVDRWQALYRACAPQRAA